MLSPQGWNLTLRRHLNDWEVERVANMLYVLGVFTGTISDPDSLRWKHTENDILTLNKLYKKENSSSIHGEVSKLWKPLWKIKAPTKIKCFTWLVVRRARLTQEVLQKKGRTLVPRCFLCNEVGETNNHLFLHCKFTVQLWHLFFTLTRIEWTMLEHTADLLSCWIRRSGSKSQKKWWRMIPSCIWWSVWKERNGRCFEDKVKSIHDVK